MVVSMVEGMKEWMLWVIFNEWNVQDVRYKIVINFGAWFRGIILMEKFEFVINLIHYYHFTLQVRMF